MYSTSFSNHTLLTPQNLLNLRSLSKGHARPLEILASNFSEDYSVTFLVGSALIPKLESNISATGSKITLIGVDTPEIDPSFLAPFEALYKAAKNLVQENKYTCVWEDIAAGAVSCRLKNEGKLDAPLLAFIVTPMAAWLGLTGSVGKFIEQVKKILDDPEQRNGRTWGEIAASASTTSNWVFSVLNKSSRFTPALFYRQQLTSTNPLAYNQFMNTKELSKRISHFRGVVMDSNGVIMQTIEEYETKETVLAAKRVLGKDGTRPLFLVGAQQPDEIWRMAERKAEGTMGALRGENERDGKMLEFLSRCQEVYGDRTVLYVAFGTVV
ncbi:hypothetical protein BT69DRAFT_1401341 [Atractiella rhizophila]|nr:hypothetical protein BT69DRAFT_1401341 [Atractiella rhizophila]